ncbi:MAG TPA: hypothetical protein PKC45_13730 [Gemmatales bacterium]|nr:hypothetical protein [Gemmatales bacterium]
MSTRTITLTGRPPVNISEDAWPIVASAADKEWDNRYECQANEISRWHVTVRQHDDGRAIVYATYSYTSNWANSRCYAAKRGVLLAADHERAAATGSLLAIKLPKDGRYVVWIGSRRGAGDYTVRLIDGD